MARQDISPRFARLRVRLTSKGRTLAIQSRGFKVKAKLLLGTDVRLAILRELRGSKSNQSAISTLSIKVWAASPKQLLSELRRMRAAGLVDIETRGRR